LANNSHDLLGKAVRLPQRRFFASKATLSIFGRLIRRFYPYIELETPFFGQEHHGQEVTSSQPELLLPARGGNVSADERIGVSRVPA
jgi:hypothetical protein